MRNKNIKIGMVVTWSGHRPAIGKIIGRCNTFNDSWKLSGESHNSCCHENLIKATEKQKREYKKAKNGDMLGKYLVLKESVIEF